MSAHLIPTALSYHVRVALDVDLPNDEAYILGRFASLERMSYLMSLRANPGLAERIVNETGEGEHHG